jgi:hypothetical protein
MDFVTAGNMISIVFTGVFGIVSLLTSFKEKKWSKKEHAFIETKSTWGGFLS